MSDGRLCSSETGAFPDDVFDLIGDAIIVTDRDGRIVRANQAALLLTGYSCAELVGAHYSLLSAAGDAGEGLPPIVARFFETGRIENHETVYRRRDGTIVPVEVNMQALRDGGGEMSGAVAAVRDISERKTTLQLLDERTRELAKQKTSLEDLNSTLHVMLERRDQDLQELRQTIGGNLEHLVQPHIDRLRVLCRDAQQLAHLDILEMNLQEITQSQARDLAAGPEHFTYVELQVAGCIRAGKTSKEAARLMGVSVKTIEFHRRNIREKLGIKNTQENLRACLQSRFSRQQS